jgi:hypothetical protein
LSYDIAHRKLSASNHVVVASLTLGAHNNSTNATHLPVKLGVALLKDRQGNINLDVPLSGSLDDPKFRVMPIVMQVLVNILEKAATSPFTLLGSMFGGGEELSYVDFPPGLADIPAPEQAKIEKLAKALYERPGLHVEISATADPVTDSPALARLKLADQIRSLRAQELIAAGTPAETVQSLQVDSTNYARLITTLYQQTIGTNAPATNVAASPTSAPSAPTAASNLDASTPPPAPSAPPIETRRTHAILHGAEMMMQKAEPEIAASIPAATPAPELAAPGGLTPLPGSPADGAPDAAAGGTNAAPGSALTPEQMEAALLAGIQITPDDLRALMVARSRSVQAALVNSGKVEGERMDVLSPKPIDPAAKGQPRVNLALD